MRSQHIVWGVPAQWQAMGLGRGALAAGFVPTEWLAWQLAAAYNTCIVTEETAADETAETDAGGHAEGRRRGGALMPPGRGVIYRGIFPARRPAREH